MAKLIVRGPVKLNGTIRIGGSKNAVLQILPACLLATKPVTLRNVPAIRDVSVMLEILEHFGMRVSGKSGTIILDPQDLMASDIPDHLARKLRASITVLGPAAGRFGTVSSLHPGGDLIGKRPVDTHFHGLAALGAKVRRRDSRYHVSGKLKGRDLFLPEASVTATASVMMAAVLAPGTTVIRNAASELHIQDLAVFLNALGAKITGAGTNVITVKGVRRLGGGSHRVRPDELEVASFMVAAALTHGRVTLEQVDPDNLALILLKMKEAGVRFKTDKHRITVKGPHTFVPTNVKTNIWPGFPTDLQPPFTVLMTQAPGMSIIHDWMYEGRFYYTEKLVGMGANITMADPHRVIVFGPTKLYGRELESPDTRAGITMLLAALIAKGTTIIDHVEWIDRGYEKIDERLRALGADVRRVEEGPGA